jgi:hypothetical protein
MLEFEEMARQNPHLAIDMDAVAASVRYARRV